MTTYLTPPVRRRPRLADEQGFRIGLAHGALVLATLSAAALGLGHASALVLLGATALMGGLAVSGSWALLLGASCWAFWTGFLDHRFGQLTLSEPDLERLLLLVALAVLGSVIAPAAGAGRRSPHRG